jgi:hypothetical protein
MTLRACAERCGFSVAVEGEGLDREIRGAYASDLMSDVLGRAKKDYLWITVQTHVNVIAVAAARELAGVLLIGGQRPEPLTMQKAREESVTLLLSPSSAFEAAGRLYEAGIRGTAATDEAI